MSVKYISWNRNGLCGAACAHMVCHARKLTGDTPADQEVIWASIKDHTNGNSKLQCTGVMPEPFENMVREACTGGARVACWETHPRALRLALKSLLGVTKVTLSQTEDEDTANRLIKSCLKRGGLPIVLIDSGAHWVLVDGWDDTDDHPVSVLDPAVGSPTSLDLDHWNIDRMAAVDCGKFDRKYVVVQVEP